MYMHFCSGCYMGNIKNVVSLVIMQLVHVNKYTNSKYLELAQMSILILNRLQKPESSTDPRAMCTIHCATEIRIRAIIKKVLSNKITNRTTGLD